MTASVIGALIGLAVAVVDMLGLRLLASRVDLDETKTALNVSGVIQLILLPVVGWFAGGYLFGD